MRGADCGREVGREGVAAGVREVVAAGVREVVAAGVLESGITGREMYSSSDGVRGRAGGDRGVPGSSGLWSYAASEMGSDLTDPEASDHGSKRPGTGVVVGRRGTAGAGGVVGLVRLVDVYESAVDVVSWKRTREERVGEDTVVYAAVGGLREGRQRRLKRRSADNCSVTSANSIPRPVQSTTIIRRVSDAVNRKSTKSLKPRAR